MDLLWDVKFVWTLVMDFVDLLSELEGYFSILSNES